MEGVVRAPSLFSMTLAVLPSITATQELVVPRSIPMTLAISTPLLQQGPTAQKALRNPPRIGWPRRQGCPAALGVDAYICDRGLGAATGERRESARFCGVLGLRGWAILPRPRKA